VIAASHGNTAVAGIAFAHRTALIWTLYVIPICAVFLVSNLTWGAFILAREQWRSSSLCLLTMPMWLAALGTAAQANDSLHRPIARLA
jgi:hypothetical protein